MTIQENNHGRSEVLPAKNEISLQDLVSLMRRRWKLLLTFALSGGVFAAIVTVRSKPVWEGYFDIVLREPSTSAPSSIANALELARGSASSSLTTQTKILESPSVLKPVFRQVKAYRESRGYSVSKYTISDWINSSLDVSLVRGTSVLSVRYRDTEPELVTTVLQQISSIYQEHASLNRVLELDSEIDYLKKQVMAYRAKSKESYKTLESFRIKYGFSDNSTFKSAPTLFDKLPAQLANIPPLSTGASEKVIPQSDGDAYGKLEAINQELVRRSAIYTPKDPSIGMLIQERNAIRSYLEKTVGGAIKLPSKLDKDQDPKSYVIRYSELSRQALRNDRILEMLENKLVSLELSKNRKELPWTLISEPSLDDKPISPRPRRNLALGIFTGLVLGFCSSLLVDKLSGKVSTEKELSEVLPFPMLGRFGRSNTAYNSRLLKSVYQYFDLSQDLYVLPLGIVESGRINNLLALEREQSVGKIIVCQNLLDVDSCRQILFVASENSITRSELGQALQILGPGKNNLTGWIWLDY